MGLFTSTETEETENEILRDIRTALTNLASQDGETTLTDQVNDAILYDYVSVPSNGDLLGFAAGTLTVDFVAGTVQHSAQDLITDDITTLDDLDGNTGELRSFSMGIDTPAKIRLGTNDWVKVDPGVYQVAAQRFSSLKIKCDIPAAVNIMASTRSQAFVKGNINVNLLRLGDKSGTIDSYETVPVYPLSMLNYVDQQTADNYAAGIIPNDAPEKTTVTVLNTGGNAIDARLQASELSGEQWYEIGEESTNIAPGDHSIFSISEAHQFIRPQLRNSSNGDPISVRVDCHGRGR